MNPAFNFTFLKIILLFSSAFHMNCGLDLSEHFELPPCCYGPTDFAERSDSDTAYTLQKENEFKPQTNQSSSSNVEVYKLIVTILANTSQAEQNKSKRSTDEDIKLGKFDHVEVTDLQTKINLPSDWQNQLRRALYESMNPNATKLRKNSTYEDETELWKNLKVAPLEIINPSTRTVSTLEEQPVTFTNFSGVMVNTKSGLEIRTSASNPVSAKSDSPCDCPLIQRGDMLLAYWSVNNKLMDGGQSAFEYQVYPVPSNVPTPPVFIPFVPDLSFQPSPIDLNAEEHPPEFHNLEQFRHALEEKIPNLSYPEGSLPLKPDFPHLGLPLWNLYAKRNTLEIASNLIETPDGYTPGFLEWYRSVLERQFRLSHDTPLGPPPDFHHHFHNFGHLPPPFFPPLGINSPPPHPPNLPPPLEIPPIPFPPVQDAGAGLQEPQLPPQIPFDPNYMQNIGNPDFPDQIAPGLGMVDPNIAMDLPNHIPPNFNHPKSIQEIINMQVPVHALGNPNGLGERARRVVPDCNGHGRNNEIYCNLPRPHPKEPTPRSTERPYARTKLEQSNEVQNHKEPSYILNF